MTADDLALCRIFKEDMRCAAALGDRMPGLGAIFQLTSTAACSVCVSAHHPCVCGTLAAVIRATSTRLAFHYFTSRYGVIALMRRSANAASLPALQQARL